MADVIPYDRVNYLQEMRDRVTFAFKDSPVFDKYLQLFAGGVEGIQTVLEQLMTRRSIDTAVGAQLDIIGDIVGQPRTLVNAENFPFFGFQFHPDAESYGDENDPAVGGYYWDETKPRAGNVTLTDSQYRLFIKAKIMKNTTNASPESVIQFIRFVFNAAIVQYNEEGGGKVHILVGATLSVFERSLLSYFLSNGEYNSHFLPKPLGVSYTFGVLPGDEYFGYLGAPGAEGYGTLVGDDVVGGGVYASLF